MLFSRDFTTSKSLGKNGICKELRVKFIAVAKIKISESFLVSIVSEGRFVPRCPVASS